MNKTIWIISDIIRISLLKYHGGIWCDATMLCLQSLDNWVNDCILQSGIWMYNNGKGGPASWFIVCVGNTYIINCWKEDVDNYWKTNNKTDDYFWMDMLFRKRLKDDNYFKELWENVPSINCNQDGSAHTLAQHDMFKMNTKIQKLLDENPPYALKLWNHGNRLYTDNDKFKNTNGIFAIQCSKKKY
jgi:hypothetical protein